MNALAKLLNNSRFYILVSSVLLSLLLASWLRMEIAADRLYYIRLGQLFGLTSILYWYFAIILSPLSKLTGPRFGMRYLLFARRAIGVSAAYFAVLHAYLAFFQESGGFAGLSLLPGRFQWSLVFAVSALAILVLLAATSFDKIIMKMTFPRWKAMQRLIYVGGVLAVLHVWLTGTHIAYGWVQWVAFASLFVLFGLESWRAAKALGKKFASLAAVELFIILFISIWVSFTGLLLMLPKAAINYHSQHLNHAEAGHGHE
jgi:sulfoxide reductase heme-binding subunit YedZ